MSTQKVYTKSFHNYAIKAIAFGVFALPWIPVFPSICDTTNNSAISIGQVPAIATGALTFGVTRNIVPVYIIVALTGIVTVGLQFKLIKFILEKQEYTISKEREIESLEK